MAYELKEGQGSLFRNDKQSERQPDYRGSIVIGGVTYTVAAWERTSQRGLNYLSLQAELPRERSEQQPISPYQREVPVPPVPPPLPSYQAPPQSVPAPTAGDEPVNMEEDLPF